MRLNGIRCMSVKGGSKILIKPLGLISQLACSEAGNKLTPSRSAIKAVGQVGSWVRGPPWLANIC